MALESGRKLFLANTRIEAVNSVSSEFNTKVREVSVGSSNQGNLSLEATVDPDVGVDVGDYTVAIKKNGRTDGKLLSIEETEVELGTGQVTDIQEITYKGDYDPPKYKINDGTYDYGTQKTMGKMVFGTDTDSNITYTIHICDRDDDSYFVFYTEVATYTQTRVYTAPKQSKTDSNVLTRHSVSYDGTSYTTIASTRIKENRYLLVGLNSIDKSLSFILVDENGDGVNAYEYSIPQLQGANGALNVYGLNVDMISDMKGNVYIALSGALVDVGDTPGATDSTIMFFKSSDFGATWNPVLSPGTKNFASIGNPIYVETDNNINPHAAGGYGYSVPRLHYDEINKTFLVMSFGYTTAGSNKGRFVISHSKDFINWSSHQFPIFRTANIDDTASGDFDHSLSVGGIARYGEEIICMTSTVVSGLYTSAFSNDTQKYGIRTGTSWCGDTGGLQKGEMVSNFCLKNIDGVIYIANTFYDQLALNNLPGLCVHAIGIHTNLNELTPYKNSYFGNINLPTDIGWTLAVGGTTSETITDDGLEISTTTGIRSHYRTDLTDSDTDGNHVFKARFSIKPVTGTYSVGQGARFKLYSTVGGSFSDFSIFVGTDGIEIYDHIAASNVDTVALSLTNQEVHIYLAWYCGSGINGELAVYYNLNDIEDFDKWININQYTVDVNASVTSQEVRFGCYRGSNTTEAVWRNFYYADTVDNTDISYLFSDHNDSPYSTILDWIPIQKELENEKTIDGLTLNWQGLDGYEDDEFTIVSESEFPVENSISKFPHRVWRAADGSAESSVSAEVNFVLDAQDSSIGKFIFDSFITYLSNFKNFTLEANDTDVWTGPPTYTEDFDMTLSTGTIDINQYRGNEDIFDIDVLLDTAYQYGELRDKYIMLERLFLFNVIHGHTTYGNVGFKIIDNGKSYGSTNKTRITFSSKNLVDPYAATAAPSDPLQVVSGDDVVIYETKYIGLYEAIKEFRFIRLVIPISDTYAAGWVATNQPSLPNEKSWKLSGFDAGTRTEVAYDADTGQGTNLESGIDLKLDAFGRIDLIQKNKRIKESFSLKYSYLDDDDYESLLALITTVHTNGFKPFWYAPDVHTRPHMVYLVNIKNLKSKKMLPDYQTEELNLEEVM